MTENYSKHRLFTTKKVIAIMIYMLVFYSCNTYSKDDYLKDLIEFVGEVEINYKNYTEEDWKLKELDFKNYTTDLYNQVKAELTTEDQKQIGRLKTRYLLIKSK